MLAPSPLTPLPRWGEGNRGLKGFLILGFLCLAGLTFGQGLPGTQPLDWQGDLSERMMEGAHRFVERKIGESIEKRQRHWKRDFSSRQAYEASVESNRQRLKKIIGVVDSRLPTRMERFGDDENPALVAETTQYRIFQVRWPVLDGVTGEGLLLEPKVGPVAYIVALPDADQTPEQIAGLAPGVARETQFARRLAERGVGVLVPALIDRSSRWSGHPDFGQTDQTHREWIYRQAFHMGRHIIGYEVQKVLAAVDWFKAKSARSQGWRRWLWGRRIVGIVCCRCRSANRCRAGEWVLRIASGSLVRTHLQKRLGATRRVWRCRDRHAHCPARLAG